MEKPFDIKILVIAEYFKCIQNVSGCGTSKSKPFLLKFVLPFKNRTLFRCTHCTVGASRAEGDDVITFKRLLNSC